MSKNKRQCCSIFRRILINWPGRYFPVVWPIADRGPTSDRLPVKITCRVTSLCSRFITAVAIGPTSDRLPVKITCREWLLFAVGSLPQPPSAWRWSDRQNYIGVVTIAGRIRRPRPTIGPMTLCCSGNTARDTRQSLDTVWSFLIIAPGSQNTLLTDRDGGLYRLIVSFDRIVSLHLTHITCFRHWLNEHLPFTRAFI